MLTELEKKKANRKNYRFRKEEGKTLIKAPGSLNGKDFKIIYLKECEVYIYDHIAAVSPPRQPLTPRSTLMTPKTVKSSLGPSTAPYLCATAKVRIQK